MFDTFITSVVAPSRAVNPDIELQLSATTGDGLDTWYRWLEKQTLEGDG